MVRTHASESAGLVLGGWNATYGVWDSERAAICSTACEYMFPGLETESPPRGSAARSHKRVIGIADQNPPLGQGQSFNCCVRLKRPGTLPPLRPRRVAEPQGRLLSQRSTKTQCPLLLARWQFGQSGAYYDLPDLACFIFEQEISCVRNGHVISEAAVAVPLDDLVKDDADEKRKWI